MNVATVVGTGSQYVKAASVSRALRADHEETIVYTGDRRSAGVREGLFDELAAPEPDRTLGVGSRTHAEQTAVLLGELDDVLAAEDPDVVLVYGDSSATLSAALVGAKRGALVAHVEAGLRSSREVPEELTRVLTDHCSGLLFVPSARAEARLANEGITDSVRNTGDVMAEALLSVRERARDRSDVLDDLDHDPGEYVLATLHRASTAADPARLRAILDGLADAPRPVVVPSHPRTAEAIRQETGAGGLPDRVELLDPVEYLDFVRLLDAAERVATDADRVQKEAFYLDTPCVTLQAETPWIETVTCGWNVLVGTEPAAIARNLDRRFGVDPADKPEPYGSGDAAGRVVEALEAAVADERDRADERVGGLAT